MNQPNVSRAQILTSWKEIASYLGKGVRTVQRWERDMGLPIRRPNGQHNKVLAECPALDEWLKTSWSQRLADQENETPSNPRERMEFAGINQEIVRAHQLRITNAALREQVQVQIHALFSSCTDLRKRCEDIAPKARSCELPAGLAEESVASESKSQAAPGTA